MAQEPRSSRGAQPQAETAHLESEEELVRAVSGKLGRRVALEDIERAVPAFWSPPYDSSDVQEIVKAIGLARPRRPRAARRPGKALLRREDLRRLRERLGSPTLSEAASLIHPLLGLPREGLSGPLGEFWKDQQARKKLLRQHLEALGWDLYDWERRLAILTFAVARWLGAPCMSVHRALADLISWGGPVATEFIVEAVTQEYRGWEVTKRKAVEDAIFAIRARVQEEETKRLQEARRAMKEQGVPDATATVLLTQRPLPAEEDGETEKKERVRPWSERDLLLPLFVFNYGGKTWEAARIGWNGRFPEWRFLHAEAVRVAYSRSIRIFGGLEKYPPLRALQLQAWAHWHPPLKILLEGLIGPGIFESGVAVD